MYQLMTCAPHAGTWTHQNRTAAPAPIVHQHPPVTHAMFVSPASPSFARAADGSCRHDRGRGYPAVHTLAPVRGH